MGSIRAVVAGRGCWVAVFALLLLVSSSAPVLADSPSEPPPVAPQSEEKEPGDAQLPPLPTSQEIGEAIETEGSGSIVPGSTDPGAAEEMPHEDLDRSEALELLQAVFEPELQGPAGPFDELHVEKFLADNVAVIPAGQQPEAPTPAAGEETGSGSTMPRQLWKTKTEWNLGRCCSVIRRIYTTITVGVVVAALTLAGTACGSQSAIDSPTLSGCVIKAHDVKSKILPQNSGFTCGNIKSIMLVLPNAVGIWPLESSTKGQGEVCRVYPKSALPLEVRCHHGARHFEVVRISR